jgi:hypothetical protein
LPASGGDPHTQEGEGIHQPVTKQLGHHPARTHGNAAVLPTLSTRFYTPMLRPKSPRRGEMIESLKCRTRASPGSVGRGAHRVRGAEALQPQTNQSLPKACTVSSVSSACRSRQHAKDEFHCEHQSTAKSRVSAPKRSRSPQTMSKIAWATAK